MEKRFNITGSCNPNTDYMVDISGKLEQIKQMIDRGEYFTINRARQFGKTTALDAIWKNMSGQYLVLLTSFEGIGDTPFESPSAFVESFYRLMIDYMEAFGEDEKFTAIWKQAKNQTIEDLSSTITRFCKAYPKPVVLLIDEVDKSSDNQLFLNFIGMLRNKYLGRKRLGKDFTFHSVILAGVYDVKNLKLKIRPDAERKYNSPWNIAADFNVDMSFNPQEISTMLIDYENDNHTGMDVMAMSNEIYKYTSGYPFLVSKICKLIDEELDRNWTSDGVMKAVKIILVGDNTLIDDLSKNLENIPELREFLYSISVNSEDYAFVMVDPMVRLASMFAYIRNDNGRVRIHNTIFEESLYYYFTMAYMRKNPNKLSPFQLNYVQNGRLNMEFVIDRFSALMHEEYRSEDDKFLERQGRLIFLSFLKPIINGAGFYYVEPQTRENSRMDLVVTFGGEEFVIELKIWRGQKYEIRGEVQLAEYLETRGLDKGYLVTFDFSKNKFDFSKNKIEKEAEWIEYEGKRIFEAVI